MADAVARIINVFKERFDELGHGAIRRGDLAFILTKLLPDSPPNQTEALMDAFDRECAEHISYERFVAWLFESGGSFLRAFVDRTPAAATEGVQEEDWSWRRVVLGRYAVRGTDVLGVGNFSVVRRGVDSETGATVAVKSLKHVGDDKFRREVFLFRELLGDPPGLKSDSRQAQTTDPDAPKPAQRSMSLLGASGELGAIGLPRPEDMFVRMLNHSPLDSSARGQPCYCILEMGQFTLHDLVVQCSDMARSDRTHSLSKEEELPRVLLHVVRALAFLHSRFFAHGDVKPANMMWFGNEKEGAWKLIDLDGLLTSSQLVDMRDADFYTPIYAAPELGAAVVVEGPLRISRHLDVWAAGATVLEMDLLRPPLWDKFEELSSGDSRGGVAAFMRWLSESPSPMPFPEAPRVASRELLEVLRGSMLVGQPLRSSAAELMEHPYLCSCRSSSMSVAPAPTLKLAAPPPAPVKTLTSFQLFQALHRPALEQEGLKGRKLLQELHRRWKQLQTDGGEELEQWKLQEAALRNAGA